MNRTKGLRVSLVCVAILVPLTALSFFVLGNMLLAALNAATAVAAGTMAVLWYRFEA